MVLFACSMTCCSSSNLISAATGPKISSCSNSDPGCTSPITVGVKKLPPSGCALPPVNSVAPRLMASSEQGLHFAPGVGVDQRANLYIGLAAIAHFQGGDASDEFIAELVVDGAMNIEAAGRRRRFVRRCGTWRSARPRPLYRYRRRQRR